MHLEQLTYYTKGFRLTCQNDNGIWSEVEGSKIFQANYDADTVVSNKLASPIECRALRILPTGNPEEVKMRSEVMVIISN